LSSFSEDVTREIFQLRTTKQIAPISSIVSDDDTNRRSRFNQRAAAAFDTDHAYARAISRGINIDASIYLPYTPGILFGHTCIVHRFLAPRTTFADKSRN
jgi:hypothetical protein